MAGFKAWMRRHGLRIALGILITFALVLYARGDFYVPALAQLEAWSYDFRVKNLRSGVGDSRIVIVDIDEKSLAEEGQWPWRRDSMALLVERVITQYKASVLGFDVVFAERDETSGLSTLRSLEKNELKNVPEFKMALSRLSPTLDFDALFARALENRPVILGYYFTSEDQHKARASGSLPKPTLTQQDLKGYEGNFIFASGYGANLPELQMAASGAGHFNPELDVDGVVRRLPMLMRYGSDFYAHFSLAVAHAYLGFPPVTVGPKPSHGYAVIDWLKVGPKVIPVDKQVTALVPYAGKQGSFVYVSAVDVLRGRIAPDVLRGKIVLVGTTALGLMDARSTPVGNVFPGVEINANMISGVLNQNIKSTPEWITGLEILTLVLLGALLSILLPFLGPFQASMVAAGVLLATIIGNILAWQYANLVLPVASVLSLTILIFALNTSYGYFVETRAKRQMARRFGQYVPPELVEEMSRNPESCTMEGESRYMTVMFSDVRNFTKISEGLDPKALSALMNEYLTAMTQIIHKHRGTIDKYIGDAIMAFWGAPLKDENHAHRAVMAALEMQVKMRELAPQFAARGWPVLTIGIGINTGWMSVGNMGSEFRRAYTVMGDAVNLASRLESLTKEYAAEVIVAEESKTQSPQINYRELDRVRVKGKIEPVGIFEPLGLGVDVAPDALERLEAFHKALALYRAREWERALAAFKALGAQGERVELVHLYLSRAEYFSINPPDAAWSGVFEFSTK